MHLKTCSPHGDRCQLPRSNARGTTIGVRKEGQILKLTLLIGNFSCYLMAKKFNATHDKDSLTAGSCAMVPGLGLHTLPDRQPLSQPHILFKGRFCCHHCHGPPAPRLCLLLSKGASTIWIPSVIVTDSHRLNTVLFHFN